MSTNLPCKSFRSIGPAVLIQPTPPSSERGSHFPLGKDLLERQTRLIGRHLILSGRGLGGRESHFGRHPAGRAIAAAMANAAITATTTRIRWRTNRPAQRPVHERLLRRARQNRPRKHFPRCSSARQTLADSAQAVKPPHNPVTARPQRPDNPDNANYSAGWSAARNSSRSSIRIARQYVIVPYGSLSDPC